MKRLSNQEIIELFQNKPLEILINSNLWVKNGLPSYKYIRSRFQSIDIFLKDFVKIDYKQTTLWRFWSNDEIVEYMRSQPLDKQLDYKNWVKNNMPDRNTIKRIFGISLYEFLEKRLLIKKEEFTYTWDVYSDEELIYKFKDVEFKELLIVKNWSKIGLPPPDYIRKRYHLNSKQFLRDKINSSYAPNWDVLTNDEITVEFKKYTYEEIKKVSTWTKLGLPKYTIIQKRFNISGVEFLNYLGHNRKTITWKYKTNEEIIKLFKECAISAALDYPNWTKNKLPSTTSIMNKFKMTPLEFLHFIGIIQDIIIDIEL